MINELRKFYTCALGKTKYEQMLAEQNSILSFIKEADFYRYKECFRAQQLFEEERRLNEDKNFSKSERDDALMNIQSLNFVKDDYDSFYEESCKGGRAEYLTPYTKGELISKGYHTYQTNGGRAGFYIGEDGYVGGLYNNSGIRGLGIPMLLAAKELGGTHADHFDGYLSELYDGISGFNVVGHDIWNDDYAPSNWKYEGLDARNVHYIYGQVLSRYKDDNILPQSLKDAIERYKKGTPDIVYRRWGGSDIRGNIKI